MPASFPGGRKPLVIRGINQRKPNGRGEFFTRFADSPVFFDYVTVFIDEPLYLGPRQWVNWAGWQVSPTPEDVIPVEDYPPLPIVELAPTVRDRHDFTGWALEPLADDNEVSFNATWLLPNPSGLYREPHQGQQLAPLADDNYESFSRVWEALAPPGLYREPHQGLQFMGERPDFFEQEQETITRRHDSLPQLNRVRLLAAHDFGGQQFGPLADDNYEASARLHDALPPVGKGDPYDYTGVAAAPLSADNYESFARTCVEVPPGRNPTRSPWDGFQLGRAGQEQDFIIPFEGQVPGGHNPLRAPWEGAQASPLSDDLPPETPAIAPVYVDFAFPRFRRDSPPLYAGFFTSPLSDDFVPTPGTGTVWRPTFMPRRR